VKQLLRAEVFSIFFPFLSPVDAVFFEVFVNGLTDNCCHGDKLFVCQFLDGFFHLWVEFDIHHGFHAPHSIGDWYVCQRFSLTINTHYIHVNQLPQRQSMSCTDQNRICESPPGVILVASALYARGNSHRIHAPLLAYRWSWGFLVLVGSMEGWKREPPSAGASS